MGHEINLEGLTRLLLFAADFVPNDFDQLPELACVNLDVGTIGILLELLGDLVVVAEDDHAERIDLLLGFEPVPVEGSLGLSFRGCN